jgi:hypothetical protein
MLQKIIAASNRQTAQIFRELAVRTPKLSLSDIHKHLTKEHAFSNLFFKRCRLKVLPYCAKDCQVCKLLSNKRWMLLWARILQAYLTLLHALLQASALKISAVHHLYLMGHFRTSYVLVQLHLHFTKNKDTRFHVLIRVNTPAIILLETNHYLIAHKQITVSQGYAARM